MHVAAEDNAEPESSTALATTTTAADSSLLVDDLLSTGRTFDVIVEKVAEHLIVPPHQPINAARDNANTRLTAEDGISAFAKIVGYGWTYYVKRTTINFGRTSDPPQHLDPNHEEYVHIDLSPSKMISRRHVTIFFSDEYNGGCWILEVRGRNGVRLNTVSEPIGAIRPLSSGDVLEIGGIEVMIVLPEQQPLKIHETYLQRARLIEKKPPVPADDVAATLPSSTTGRPSSPQSASQSRQARGQQPIAPAPPNYRRPGTPPSARNRAQSAAKSSPSKAGGAGSMMLNTNEIDLSLDENKAIKPQYSYAQMITQAILKTDEEKLNLAGIYNYIMTNYAYYRHQLPSGWQVSFPDLSDRKTEFAH